MKVVSLTATSREEYLREVLLSWRKARGVEDYHFIFNVEPINTDIEQICRRVDWVSSETIVNPSVYGPLGNPWYAFERGFDKSDYVILAEDDSIVSEDVFEYFEWAEKYRTDSECIAACAFHHGYCNHHVMQVSKNRWFAPTIWATWKEKWVTILRDTWDFDYSKRGWDWNINDNILTGDRYCLTPCHSRSQHIGKYGGAHCTPEIFDELQASRFLPTALKGRSFFEGQCESL